MAPHSTIRVADDPIMNGASVSSHERNFIGAEDNAHHIGHKLGPIAIVGLSLKFPEDATCVEDFWQLLMERRCVSTKFPRDRISVSDIYHPGTHRPDTVRLTLHLL